MSMFPELKGSLFAIASRDARQLRKRVELLESALRYIYNNTDSASTREVCRITLELNDEL